MPLPSSAWMATMPRRPGSRDRGRSKKPQYAPIPYELLESPAWRSLSPAAVKVWCELRTRFKRFNNDRLQLPLSYASKRLRLGRTTVARALAELEEKGFIEKLRQGEFLGHQAALYRLTSEPVVDQNDRLIQGATNDWKSWRPPQSKNSAPVPYQDP